MNHVHAKIIVSVMIAAFLPLTFQSASAWETYHDPNQDDAGYCSTCHPGFLLGPTDSLHALHTGGSDPITTDCDICHTPGLRDNPLTMWSVDGLGCTGCHGRDYGEVTGGNYRGFATFGLPKASGYGLRKHHLNAGVSVCLSCHEDVDQGLIFTENVDPPYYASPSVSLGGVSADSCVNEDTANDVDALGLDNDGDLIYDGADPNCLGVLPAVFLNPSILDFGDVAGGQSMQLTTAVENVGGEELYVSSITRCSSTSPEFTWSPAPPFSVPPGSSQTLTVTYSPVDVGVDMGCLEVHTNDSATPVALLDVVGSGTQPQILLSPSFVNFGTLAPGGASTMVAEILNVGTADLTVSQVALCAGTSSVFSFAAVTPVTILPGGSELVSITYSPVVVGTDFGCLEIASDDPSQPLAFLDLGGIASDVTQPDIVLDPPLLDFGALTTGDSVSLITQVRNLGSSDLSVNDITLCSSTSSEFTWSSMTPVSIPPGGSQPLTVTYAPVDAGPDAGCLEVVSDDPDEPIATLSVIGEAVGPPAPHIVLDPPAVDFGSALTGSSTSQQVWVRNTGPLSLSVNVSRCVGTSTEFTWYGGGFFIVPPGGAENLLVVYAPTDLGSDVGCLALQTNDPDQPTINIELAGLGTDVSAPDIALTPASLDFGVALAGSFSVLNASIENTGTTWLTVSSITLCAGSSAEYSWIPGTPLNIPAHSARSLSVTYNPVDFGPDLGCLEIVSNDPDEPVITLDLAGQGVEFLEPDIVVNPVDLDFGSVFVGQSMSLSTEVQNLGLADLVVNSVTVCSGTSTEYTESFPTPITIPPGGSASLPITYSPLDVGSDVGCLDIASNDPDQPSVLVNVTGSGAGVPASDLAVDPSSLDFGTAFVGEAWSITPLIHNLGDANLVISSITLCGGTSAEYSWTPSAPLTIAPGASEALTVTYTPVDVGVDSGCLRIISNDPDTPFFNLSVLGVGEELVVLAPDIVITPTAIGFGTVFIGNSGVIPAQIDNTGTADLLVSSISSCFETSAEFTWTPDAPLTVAPGGSETVFVIYAPVDTGSDAGCIEITSDDPDQPVVVIDLVGAGAEVPPPPPHPQPITDCSNCHNDPATGEPDMVGLHGSDCSVCHTSGFGGTLLGSFGTWNGECSHCHNPSVPETGSWDTPTKGHRCVVCHGEQRSTSSIADFHEEHAEKADCVVCHGFIPYVGTEIGSGNRAICALCHGTPPSASSRWFHEKHVDEGLSCIECHGGERPPVDVVSSSPVGSSDHVCDVCHSGRSPSMFSGDSEDLHEEHSKEKLDCGSCHLNANLQEDRVPMPEPDDIVRAMVPRAGYSECAHCHEGGKSGSARRVHRKHVGKQKQWCYNCHEGTDGRPVGSEPPVTSPADACELCHNSRSYSDSDPFEVHEDHAKRLKCYSCHQATPPIFDWPSIWLNQ